MIEQYKTAGDHINEAVQACKDTAAKDMQRPFASAYEVWARLKDLLEQAKKATKDVEKIHGDIWDAVKDQNDDEQSIELRELGRQARTLASVWATVAADAERGADEV